MYVHVRGGRKEQGGKNRWESGKPGNGERGTWNGKQEHVTRLDTRIAFKAKPKVQHTSEQTESLSTNTAQ